MISITLLSCTIILSEASNLVDQALFIANNEFKHRFSTSVVWWKSDPEMVTDFLKNYQGSVTNTIIRQKNFRIAYNGDIGFKQLVFFAVDPEEFKFFITNLNKIIIYPIRVLLVITIPVHNDSSLDKYTKICMDNDVSDIVIITTRSNTSNVTLTTYMPYASSECGNHKPVTLDSDAKVLFPQKFYNFNRCPIKLTIANSFPYVIMIDNNVNNIRGIDVDILSIVFEKLNGTMSKFLSNESGANVFNTVAAGNYDMCLPSIILNTARFESTQTSYVFKTLDIILCAPNQREIYAWAKVLLPFFTNITPLIILSFVLFLGCMVLIGRFGKYRKNVNRGIIFGTLGLFLGQEIKFETKYWLNNGLFMLWIWYCTIVRIAYQSDLVEGLQNTFLEPHLKSMDEALRAVDEFGGPEGLMLLTSRKSTNAKKTTIMLWKDIPKYIEEISNGRRFLLLTDISLIHHSQYRVQIVDERMSSMPAVYIMRPRWGAAMEVNRRLVQLFEGGFMAKLARDHAAQQDRNARTVDPLTLNTVASCFFGLVIFGLLWTIVLCAEIVWYNFAQERFFKFYRSF